MIYFSTTFSPMMIDELSWAWCEITQQELSDIPPMADMKSVVGHEVTAQVLSALLEEHVPFNRVNVVLKSGDVMYVITPKFRVESSREFTREEVENAGYRCFQVIMK